MQKLSTRETCTKLTKLLEIICYNYKIIAKITIMEGIFLFFNLQRYSYICNLKDEILQNEFCIIIWKHIRWHYHTPQLKIESKRQQHNKMK